MVQAGRHAACLNIVPAPSNTEWHALTALDYEASDFERMLRVNVVGAFILVKRAARILEGKGTGGSIVIITTASMSGQVAYRVRISTSTLNLLAHPTMTSSLTCTTYKSSKSAVNQMCRSLAQDWGQSSIRVNTLSLGRSPFALQHLDILLMKSAVYSNCDDRRTSR